MKNISQFDNSAPTFPKRLNGIYLSFLIIGIFASTTLAFLLSLKILALTFFLVGMICLFVFAFAEIRFWKKSAELIYSKYLNLEQIDKHWRLAFETTDTGIWECNLVQGIYKIDGIGRKIFGFDSNESVETMEEWREKIFSEDRERVKSSYEKYLRGESESYRCEYRVRCKDGNYKWILARGKVVKKLPTGEFEILAGTYDDIDQGQKRKLELEEALSLQGAILHNAGFAIISTENDGIITSINPAAELMLGYKASELVHLKSPAIWHDPEEVVQTAAALTIELGEKINPGFDVFIAKASRNMPSQREWTYIRKDGTRVPVELSVTALRNQSGEIFGYLGMAADLAELKKSEKELKASAGRVEKALEALDNNSKRLSLACSAGGIGIWEFNVITNELFWDDAMFGLYGVNRGDFTGGYEAWAKGVHPDDLKKSESDLQEAILGIKGFDTEFRVIWPNQSIHHIRALANVTRDENGKALTMIGTNWDITTRKESEEELRLAIISSENSNRAKSEFLTSMSHEIRTPMNGVIGLSQLLSLTNLNEEQSSMVDTIRKSGESLLVLLNDILDFSKIEAGKLEIEFRNFELKKMIAEISEILKMQASAKGIVIRTIENPDIPIRLYSDAGRIRQVLLNLVGNAVKFTSQGEVIILVSKVEEYLKFEVKDSGIGIPADKHHLIFRKFSQADSSTSRRFGGTGLGLAISKRLVELMGGTIGFTSNEREGSVFWFTIPNEQNIGESEIASEKSPNSGADISWSAIPDEYSSLNILVVDDNEVNRLVIAGMLRKLKARFKIANSGEQAIEYCFKEKFSLILMDCEMPEMDGLDATREIRSKEALENLGLSPNKIHRRVFALTANAMIENKNRCLEAGMDGFISKPIKLEDLKKTLWETFQLESLIPVDNPVPLDKLPG